MRRRTAITPQAVAIEPPPFGIEYQGQLLRMLLADAGFASSIHSHIQPTFFQNPAHAWAWNYALQYVGNYGMFPSMNLLVDQAGRMDPASAPVYQAALVVVRDQPETDRQWLVDQTLEWIRKNVFMRAFLDVKDLWNNGKRIESYDRMREAMAVVDTVEWGEVDRGWYNREQFAERHIQRQEGTTGKPIGTGIHALDVILEGGARPGFVGTWIAYPKVGKTTMLNNLGAVSVRAYLENTLHVVLEGSRWMVETRYDAIFMDEYYSAVKAGTADANKYAAAMSELEYLRNKLVVRGFTDSWDTNILDIDEELKDLKRSHQWEPGMIILDYGDLLRGRPKKGGYKSETDEQVNAFKDIKRLAGRGYRIWTASQAQRPKNEDFAEKPHLLRSKDIADAYAKIRICDFIGSLNQTLQEREQSVMRLYAEMYRDNAADQVILIGSDFQKMTFANAPESFQNGNGAVVAQKPLGYVQSTNGL